MTSGESEISFSWANRSKYVFDGEGRLDPELFELAANAWSFLDESLNGLRLNQADACWASRVLAIYYAARIHGASAAATMAIGQRLGREAIILSRCQYEYFVKMLYYDHYSEAASDVIRLLRSYGYRFAEALGFEVQGDLPQEAIAKLEELSKRAYRSDFAAIVRALRSNESFSASARSGNPFAVGLLNNVDSMFKVLWTYGSSVLHAGVEDIVNVMIPRADGHWDVNVDSRMKAPNKTVCDVTQRCFSATGLLRWRFELGFEPRHVRWAQRFGEVAARHTNEPADIKSMHD